MSEPTGLPETQTPEAFETLYTKRLKNKCRFNQNPYQKILKLNSPKTAKAKIKRIGATYVSTDILALFHTDDNEDQEQEAPQVKFFGDSPSSDF